MYTEEQKEKLKNSIIYFVERDKNIGLTKLMKLLYYLDFDVYKKTGQSVTGSVYETWQYGPVPVAVWKELKNKDNSENIGISNVVSAIPTKIDEKDEAAGVKLLKKKTVKFSDYYFSSIEMQRLSAVSEMFKGCTASLVVEASHDYKELWYKVLKEKGVKQTIDYNLILADLSEEEKEDIFEAQQDKAIFDKLVEAYS